MKDWAGQGHNIHSTMFQDELSVMDLKGHTEPTQTSAENRRYSQILPLLSAFKHCEGAGNHRKSRNFAEQNRKMQVGVCTLKSVHFSSALVTTCSTCVSSKTNATMTLSASRHQNVNKSRCMIMSYAVWLPAPCLSGTFLCRVTKNVSFWVWFDRLPVSWSPRRKSL